MPNNWNFDEKTVLSTPNPIHSSSMAGETYKKPMMSFMNDLPQRISDINESIGILSLNSKRDIGQQSALSEAALEREKQIEMAKSSISNYNKVRTELTSIPSKYFAKSDFSDPTSELIHSESTISESDLLPANSSTPRTSLFHSELAVRDVQYSKRLSGLAFSMHKVEFDMNDIMKAFHDTGNAEDLTFRSGTEAVAQLEEDELSWQKQRAMPASIKEFSVVSTDNLKFSIGPFFKERSDDIPKMFAKSPQKTQTPVPLIEITSSTPLKSPGRVDSLGITDIEHILANESTSKALEQLMKPKKDKKSKSPIARPGPDKEEACKENISPDFNRDKTHLSTRSSSSLSSLPNGKLPIATSKTELIWGCMKPGKSSFQDFIVRNKSSSRVGIQCSVSNPSFRLNKEGSEPNFSTVKIILHPYESRTLTVTFAPTTLGGCADYLVFTSTDPVHKQTTKQFITLCGYGGYGNITIQNIIKDTSGKFLLSLGNIDDQLELKQNFVVKNYGTLPTFAYFDSIVSGVHSFASINIFPQSAVLLPGEEREILISCNLQKKNYHYIKSKIHSSVIDLGKVQMIHGTEVDRARLRKICSKAKEKKQEVHPYLQKLVSTFPGEVIPRDIKHFHESLISMQEIMRFLNNEEITVTLEQDIDYTLTEQLQDETVMFHSLYEKSITLETTVSKDLCSVDPTRIILTPPDKVKDRILLTNNHKKPVYFELNSSPEGLDVKPKTGTVDVGDTIIIELNYTHINDKTVFKVRILVDNESFEVDVKVVFVNKT